jgi:hypothetical protein
MPKTHKKSYSSNYSNSIESFSSIGSSGSNLSQSSKISEKFEESNVSKCEGNKYNINLIFIIVVFAFLYMNAGVMFPKTEFSKTNLMSGLNNLIPEFNLKK